MNIFKIICFAMVSAMLISCGGGGSGGGDPVVVTPAPVAFSLGGVAAVGDPIVNGQVNVVCAKGAYVATSTGSTGAWRMALPSHTLPCTVQVSGGTINGVTNIAKYHSIAVASGTVNITPLTDLMVANLFATRNPTAWFSGLSLSGSVLGNIDQAQVAAALTKMAGALPAFNSLVAVHPVTTEFEAVPGNAMYVMLAALRLAMTNTLIKHEDLLVGASLPEFGQLNANFNLALNEAYAMVQSGYTGRNSPFDPGIRGVMPSAGQAGAVIVILGTNFVPVPGDILSGARYQVSFNGAVVVPLTRSQSQLSVVVPSGATTGTLTVTDLQTGAAYVVPGSFTVTGAGPVAVERRFMPIPAGGQFFSPANDVEFGFVDLVGANVNITNSDIAVSMTVRDLPAMLLFNQNAVPMNSLEYEWGVDFDLNGDDQEDFSLSMSHYKLSDVPLTQSLLTGTQRNVWKIESGRGGVYLADSQASVNGNMIMLRVVKSVNAELAKITPSARVRISASYRSSLDKSYIDFIR